MDRISALRNIEDALTEFERGERDLSSLQREVQAVLQTYASEFSTGQKAVYRVEAVERDLVVVAESPADARQRASDLDADPIAVERVSEPDQR